jgi:iron complex outermembrane recepter protein
MRPPPDGPPRRAWHEVPPRGFKMTLSLVSRPGPQYLLGVMALALIAQSAMAQTTIAQAQGTAQAPTPATAPPETTKTEKVEEVVVTGSRIRREASDTTTSAPLTVVSSEDLTERGYTQVGDELNQLTQNVPQFALTPHDGSSSGSGQDYPNLFNLGAGRTLTLVNGRRFVSSGVGSVPTTGVVAFGDNVVDTNMIPTGLLDRVEVVDAGGSVVYGSDAIAGVVNYILKDHFTGAQLDAQYGQTTHGGDYPQDSIRATLGTNFADDRGNVAFNFEWSKSEPLLQSQRNYLPAMSLIPDADPRYNGPNNQGIYPNYFLPNATFWEFSNYGVPFVVPPGAPYQAAFGGSFLVTGNGNHYPGGMPVQFNAAGTGLIPYNLGTFPPGTGPNQAFVGIPFAGGGDGYPYEDLGSLYSGVERYNGMLIGHYDLTPDIKVSTELFYGHTIGTDPLGSQPSFTVLNPPASGAGAIPILASNPYLPGSAAGTITNYLNTTLGGGLGYAWAAGVLPPSFNGLVSLSKFWANLIPSDAVTNDTTSLRALLGFDGSFNLAPGDYYWSLSASRGYTQDENSSYNVVNYRFNNAIDAVTNAAGQIVCGINQTTVTDAACLPIDPFGNRPLTAAQQAYVSGLFGQTEYLKEDDVLATIGGPIVALPAGPLKFDAAYERRSDSANFDELEDTALGLGPSGAPTPNTSGQYTDNEFSGELLVPLVGKDFTLPAVQDLELHGAYRFVDNSIAGSANLWDTGIRWTVVRGLTLRASHGTNFRAPSLYDLFYPAVTALGSAVDPCDTRFITMGPNPAARMANCEALFAAHPAYNGGKGLTGYEDPSTNFATAAVTTVGNADLKNEISHTWTVGLVLQPSFVPGFTVTADRIEIRLTNAITPYTSSDYLSACYDSIPQPAAYCDSFTRDSNGDIVTATSSYVNAGLQTYRGEQYNVHYHFALAERHQFDLNLAVTHNETNTLDVAETVTAYAGTAVDPHWVGRFDASYGLGPLHVTYSLYALSRALALAGDNAQNTQFLYYASNLQHSISALYDVTSYLTVRAGITNFTNEPPSFNSLSYGDVLGRRFFVGFNLHE